MLVPSRRLHFNGSLVKLMETMPNSTEINEVIRAMNERTLGSKSESELLRFADIMNSWVSTLDADMRLVVPALEAIQNRLVHIQSGRLSRQTVGLTHEVVQLAAISDQQKGLTENLNTQTGKLIDETVALKRIAEEQLNLAAKLDTLTRWIVGLTIAILLLTFGVFAFTVYLYKDTHTEI